MKVEVLRKIHNTLGLRCVGTLISFVSLCVLLLSCKGGGEGETEVWQGSRDRIEDVEIIPLEAELPPMHATTTLYLIGDTLIFHDGRSADYQFTALDLGSDKVIGRFGKFGNGPGEIANFGGLWFDSRNRILYGMNGNHWDISGFEIDSVLRRPDYPAFVKLSFRDIENRYPVVSPTALDDSILMCSLYAIPKESGPITAHLGTLNLANGDVELLDTATAVSGGRFATTVSLRDSLVVLSYFNNDLVRLYNPSGRLLKSVYGPDYSDNPDGTVNFFYNSFIDDCVYCPYSGKNAREYPGAGSIVVLGLDGTYIKTLRLPSRVYDFAYHPGKRRIYVSSLDEPQFGYIRLGEK